MYKLFLCLRYLRSRVIAWFALASVALCVAMMLIVVSVMDGFLNKIEYAAKGLFGDVVVESTSTSGLARYDEFIAQIKKDVPQVEDASPFILTWGMLCVPGSDQRWTVQIAGIRLPERAHVTDFAKGLFVQGGWSDPTFDPPKEKVLERISQDERFLEGISAKYPGRYTSAMLYHQDGVRDILQADKTKSDLLEVQTKIDKLRQDGDPQQQIPFLETERTMLMRHRFLDPSNRVILGQGIPGLSVRTPEGQIVRYMVPGQQIVLVLLPLGRGSFANITPTQQPFTIIDDSKTDVSSIDSSIVYVPFETLQRLNEMGAQPTADGRESPARCSAVHIKVRNGTLGNEKYLMTVRDQVQKVWDKFHDEHPDAAMNDVTVKTWRERQETIVSNIAAQRTLVVVMFGVISLVTVVLVFVLFYTIVVQKTKDIGVLKAVGASSAGVANIFLGYGAVVGLVGSIAGVIGGYFFVRNINPIHDWVGRTFGLVVWNREWFLFDKIPNEVEVLPAIVIVLSAIAAGLIGSLLPAFIAARMQPVEALRYE